MATATERLGVSILKVQLGAALQKQRIYRGLTQAQVAEFADLSLKYVGEIERGEANTSLEVLERLSEAVGWNPMDTFEGVREPLSEGVRMLLLDEVQRMLGRLRTMVRWLHALDPALYYKAPKPVEEEPSASDDKRRRVKRTRPRKTRKPPQQANEESAPKEATEATEAKDEPG
jgi:transcriptional regulator with XRE-family HTH domain